MGPQSLQQLFLENGGGYVKLKLFILILGGNKMRKVYLGTLLTMMTLGFWGCSRLAIKRSPSNISLPDASFVRIRNFEIMTTEVTQKQWFDVMGDNPSKFSSEKYCDDYDEINKLCPNHPVESVSWNEVQKFIKKINDSLGLSCCYVSPQDKKGRYRLPTQAEREFAARGGTKTTYSFGDDPSLLDNYAWYYENSDNQTHKVGLKNPNPKKPNSYGLYDMHGNVEEWVQDSYTKKLSGEADPEGRFTWSEHVICGGSGISRARNVRSTSCDNDNRPDYRSTFVGFRLVRDLWPVFSVGSGMQCFSSNLVK